jgi:hypothetical protein
MSRPTLSLGALAGITAYSIHPAEQAELRSLLEKQRLELEIRENNDVITAAANGLRILAAKDSVLAALRDGVRTLEGRGSLDVPIFTYTCTGLLRDGKDVMEDGLTVAFHANSDGRNMTLRDMPPGALLRLPDHRKNFPLRKLLQGEMGRATLSLAALFIGHRVSLQVRSTRTVASYSEHGYSVGERKVFLRFWPVGLPEIYQIFLKEARERWNVPDFQLNSAYPRRRLEDVRAAPAPTPAVDALLAALLAPAAPAPIRYSVCGCVPLPARCSACDSEEPPAAWGGEAGGGAAAAPEESAIEPPPCACTDEHLCEDCEARWIEDEEERHAEDYYADYYDGEVNHGADMEW